MSDAHIDTDHHRAELLASSRCGRFYCGAIFVPAALTEWIDEDESGQGQTALCPSCATDSVIGDGAGYPITTQFLTRMRRFWFAGL
jgi:hypothetical protein